MLAAQAVAFKLYADEGMWLPILMGSNLEEMNRLGFKLTAEDIYSLNKSSLKDAVVLFGRGCTGELISDQGLLITNHHCGYGSIQRLSSVENDYLKYGFWARTRQEELPSPNLTVSFLVRMEDVTSRVLEGVTPTLTEKERESIIRANTEKVRNEAKGNSDYEVNIRPMYYGNEYYLFVYEVFRDVRLVGTPPESIGKFGGDTDNWVWPRHTGDFSLFRIYADKNNKPAAYSPDNVPYKPKRFLPISMKGIKEGDFTMVYGFPGSTQQFITSDAVRLLIEQSNPHRVALRNTRLSIMGSHMTGNDTVRIKYSSKHANVANAWKKWIGETQGLKRLNAVGKKQELEKQFESWVQADAQRKSEYKGLLPNFQRLYKELSPLALVRDYRTEAVFGVELIRFASEFEPLVSEFDSKEADKAKIEERIKGAIRSARAFYKDYHLPIDREVFAKMMQAYAEKVPAEFQPEFLAKVAKDYSGNWQTFANDIFRQTIFADSVRLISILGSIDKSSSQLIKDDYVYNIFLAFDRIYNLRVSKRYNEISDSLNILYRTYVSGLRQMQTDRVFYPDANLTLRVSYGKVGGFTPRDGVVYDYYTTLDGVVEKSTQNVPDYKVPKGLTDLYNSKDFGRYAVNGTVPVAFIASNHTTGGNSGSPVINGEGHLVGVNFDRCWESTMSDVMFDPNYCRNIALDIRYALFVIDKLAGAKNLIGEMMIVE